MNKIENVSIVGMGALGLLYGSFISKACGNHTVSYVMDKERYVRNNEETFLINGEKMHFNMVKDSEAREADLLIVAVKATGLGTALDVMERCIGPDTVIISVLNGISSERIIGDRYGFSNIIYTVAQGMDAMKFGNNLQYTQMGELRIGLTERCNPQQLIRLQAFFDSIQLKYVTETDILYRMWGKFMLNVGVNQTCMVYGTNYEGVLEDGEPNRTMIAAMREVIAIANAEGVSLTEKDLNQYIDVLKQLSPTGTPSMGQDRINHKYSEVELFAGTVIEIAKKYDIYVPTNQYLYKRVKEIEREYLK